MEIDARLKTAVKSLKNLYLRGGRGVSDARFKCPYTQMQVEMQVAVWSLSVVPSTVR